jgi:2-polyprenyl-6-methoxyphenol hydroxylase-like FAD-dependent oxidoreductase
VINIKNSVTANIAVIGCGPAGLSVSIFLRRQGHKVTLYEQFEQAGPVGAGLMLQPTGMSVLNDLGLLEKVINSAQRVNRILGTDAKSGKTILNVHYHHLGKGRFGLGIHRHALFNTLYDTALDEEVCFEFGKSINSLDVTSSGIRPITDKGQKLTEHDFVIAANGSNCAIANHTFGLKAPDHLPYGALWTSVDWPQSGFDLDVLTQRYDGAKVMIGVLPLGGGYDALPQTNKKAALFWSLKTEHLKATKARGINDWKDRICDYWPQAEALVEQINDFDGLSFAFYRHSTLKKPYDQRVIFIGDAYHSTSPQLGQGANMALLDAKAFDLALRYNLNDFTKAGEIFHHLRSRHIQLFQMMSMFLTPFYQSDSKISSFLRDHVISQISKIPPAPKMMASILSGLFMEPFRRTEFEGENLPGFSEPGWLQFD